MSLTSRFDKSPPRSWYFRVLVNHPTVWTVASMAVFWAWGSIQARVWWNIIELMMARNLLRGYGLVVAPLDPPALWRPFLGVFLCAGVELLTSDPFLIYSVIYTFSLTVFLLTMFYAARRLGGLTAAHLSSIFILTNGAMSARLVNHVQSISHLALLLVLGPALLITVQAAGKFFCGGAFAVGLAWGLVYLARWETLAFFAITLALVAYLSAIRIRTPAALLPVAAAVFGFGIVTVPLAVYQHSVRARWGIWGTSAITTFYASEAWVHGDGNEDAGFAQSVRKYGTLEENRFSVLRAIARNPPAFLDRLHVNAPRFLALFTDRTFFDPLWLIGIVAILSDIRWLRKNLPVVAWLALLPVSSASVCAFQIDSRYLTIALPGILLLACSGLVRLVERSAAIARFRIIGAAVLAALLLARCAPFSYRQWAEARAAPARLRGAHDVSFARTVADHLARVATPGAPIAVMFSRNTDMFLISYFAGTAICWKTPGLYPRDKIFSWTPRDPDYVYATPDTLLSTDLLLKSRPIGKFSEGGRTYYLLRTPWRPFDSVDAVAKAGAQPNFATPWELFNYRHAASFKELESAVASTDPALWTDLLQANGARP